jgi:hypothetical protein
MLRLLGLALAASFTSCSHDDVGDCPCPGYVACAYKTGDATPGSLDATYSQNGSCWTTTTTANMCCDFCRQEALNWESTGIAADAGCTIPWAEEPTG